MKNLCKLCDLFGGGETWYFKPENYARNIYKLRTPGHKAGSGKDPETVAGELMMGALQVKFSNPEKFPELREEVNKKLLEVNICQVVTLEECNYIIENLAHPLALVSCICRRLLRAREETDWDSYSCLAIGVGVYKWERWPERYKGGVLFVSPQEAKEWIANWDKKGMVHLVMTFGSPYIGGICNCDYDCLALRMRQFYDFEYVLKGHYVAKIDFEKCKGCGTCATRCQFGAIRKIVTRNKFVIDMTKCYGCAVCVTGCKNDAISLIKRESSPSLKNLW
jgi:NAD-dependent dihydropyrimidine dehydrogenase PreA subunit